jgi:hypothetical protein
MPVFIAQRATSATSVGSEQSLHSFALVLHLRREDWMSGKTVKVAGD